MAGLSHIKDLAEKKGKEFIENLLNKHVIVNEKMDGAFFGVQKSCETGQTEYLKKNGKISYIDRVLSKYYEPAVSHFESIGKENIPCGHTFGFEFFTNKNSQNIEYDRLPQNQLILSYVHVLDESGNIAKTVQDSKTLNEWADKMQVERPPIVFEGKLTDDQRVEIMDFIYTPTEELLEKFKTESFTKHILGVFNPALKDSFLKEGLDKSIEGLVFRFYDPEVEAKEDSVFLAKLVDPWFQQSAIQRAENQRAESKKSDDYIWITVIDLMNYIERFSNAELRALDMTGNSPEEKYVSLINSIYLGFVKEFGDKYLGLDIKIPDYLKKDEFGVNFDLINNPEVIEKIEANPNFKEIYRILLNVFRKKNIRIGASFFTAPMKEILHSQINKISNIVNENVLYENYFPTFSEFVGTDSEPGYFESFAEVPSEKRKTKLANIVISDFQPITNSHSRVIDRMFEENGHPIVLIGVHPGNKSKRFPISPETIKTTLKKYASSNPEKVAGFFLVNEANIEKIINSIKPDFEPVSLCADKGRLADIALQLEHAKKRSRNLNLKNNLNLFAIPYSPEAFEALEAIKAQDFAKYKSLTPSAIHSEFFTYNRDL
jgi:hypothetical protein